MSARRSTALLQRHPMTPPNFWTGLGAYTVPSGSGAFGGVRTNGTASRAIDTVYHNTSGKTLFVSALFMAAVVAGRSLATQTPQAPRPYWWRLRHLQTLILVLHLLSLCRMATITS